MAKSVDQIDFIFLCAFPEKFNIPHLMAREIEAYFVYKKKPTDEELNRHINILCKKYKIEEEKLCSLHDLLF